MKNKDFFKNHPTRETAILGLIRGETTDNSWGFRFGNSNQYWAAINEELQAAFIGEKLFKRRWTLQQSAATLSCVSTRT
jgi:sn-glycerol 3-phosphate transport system substrate-binding protein